MRRNRLLLASAALGGVLALGLGVPAAAAPALAPAAWIVANGTQPALTDYTATPSGPFWSAVVLDPGYQSGDDADPDQDYDLWAYDSAGKGLASSRLGIGEIDYVAIDSNTRTVEPYRVQVQKFHATSTHEQYRLVFASGTLTVGPGRTALAVPPGPQPNNAYVRDIYLRAGSTATVFAAGDNVTCPTSVGTLFLHAFLLGTDPANPATAVQGRPGALARSFSLQQHGTACGVTLTYTAKTAGWYGLLIVDPGFTSPFTDITVTP
ncbi:MAG: hypothetical protein QOJ50_2317 [Cryptosporangiaceae bacterium]|jgi:hypothetical protein|nr:hypothetical protein [Cryptosporangiaceae bacterium]